MSKAIHYELGSLCSPGLCRAKILESTLSKYIIPLPAQQHARMSMRRSLVLQEAEAIYPEEAAAYNAAAAAAPPDSKTTA